MLSRKMQLILKSAWEPELMTIDEEMELLQLVDDKKPLDKFYRLVILGEQEENNGENNEDNSSNYY